MSPPCRLGSANLVTPCCPGGAGAVAVKDVARRFVVAAAIPSRDLGRRLGGPQAGMKK
jgi:hypothetical protein